MSIQTSVIARTVTVGGLGWKNDVVPKTAAAVSVALALIIFAVTALILRRGDRSSS